MEVYYLHVLDVRKVDAENAKDERIRLCNRAIAIFFALYYVIVEREEPRHDVHSITTDNVTCRFLISINCNVSQSTSVRLAE